MIDYIYHAAHAQENLRLASASSSLVHAAIAQANATLALAEQQRIANVVALVALDADTDEKELLSREAALSMIEYWDEVLIVSPEIAMTLGIEDGDPR